jgi:hypothetical protein
VEPAAPRVVAAVAYAEKRETSSPKIRRDLAALEK